MAKYVTYETIRAGIVRDYEELMTDLVGFDFEEATGAILDDLDEGIVDDAATNLVREPYRLMTFVLLAIIGLERGELLPEVREGVLEIVREDKLRRLRRRYSREDYAAISRDLESVKAKLGA